MAYESFNETRNQQWFIFLVFCETISRAKLPGARIDESQVQKIVKKTGYVFHHAPNEKDQRGIPIVTLFEIFCRALFVVNRIRIHSYSRYLMQYFSMTLFLHLLKRIECQEILSVMEFESNRIESRNSLRKHLFLSFNKIYTV